MQGFYTRIPALPEQPNPGFDPLPARSEQILIASRSALEQGRSDRAQCFADCDHLALALVRNPVFGPPSYRWELSQCVEMASDYAELTSELRRCLVPGRPTALTALQATLEGRGLVELEDWNLGAPLP